MITDNNIERRLLSTPVEIRTDDYGIKTISGYALVFDQLSEDLGGFREKINPGAIDGVVERSDILALLNHDEGRGILARSRYGKGSLSLTIDERGLFYSFIAPHTSLGEEVTVGVQRGDIIGSSFAFTVAEDSWDYEKKIRTIKKIERLFDVSPVYTPAYSSTSVVVDQRCAKRLSLQEYYVNKRKLLNNI